ncbi:MAG: helix-turn-helix transcriptional regulator [Pseudonocardia sp.]|nr:helix-turn-helix transcriptional regulator [Pseudonocardia sp.]
MPDSRSDRDSLSGALRELRDVAGLRQVDAATQAGISQSLIAKFENARQVPRVEHVEKLCAVYGAPAAARRRLTAIATDMRAGNQRVVLRRDAEPAQKRIGRIQEASTLQRTFSPSGLPGLLQTADYCRALFDGGTDLDPDAAEAGAAARLENQDALATERQFSFLLPEGSLGWALLAGDGMAEQMEHLAAITTRPNVRLGIVPWGQPVPELPLNSWTEFDDQLVIVGTTTRVAYLTVQGDVDAYRQLFDHLSSFAVFDEAARAILRDSAQRYRSLARPGS